MTRRRVLAMVDHGVDRHLLKRLVKVRRGWRKASETGRCGSVDLTLPLAPRIGAVRFGRYNGHCSMRTLITVQPSKLKINRQ